MESCLRRLKTRGDRSSGRSTRTNVCGIESGRSVGCVMGRFRKVIRLGSKAFEERDDGLKAETGESGQGEIEERSCRSGVRTGRVCGKSAGYASRRRGW